MGRVKDKTYVDPKEVYNYLVANKGLSKAHALGILANIQAESGFNASAIGDGGTSGGLFQHHASRFSALKEHSGGEWTNWTKQVDYALSEGATKKYVAKQFATPEDASMWWTTEWERPADKYEKAKQRVNNINKFTHFTDYEATPYQGGAATNPNASSYTPGITPSNALSTPVRFQIMTADGPTFSDIDPVEFQKELDKLTVIEKKVEESPERLAIEEKKETQKSFLTAMMVDNSSIVSYLPEGAAQGAHDTGVVATEKIEIPERVDALPQMPNIFSMGQQVEEYKEGGQTDSQPIVSTEGYKQGPPPPGYHYRIPGNEQGTSIHNPTPYPLDLVGPNGTRAQIEPWDTKTQNFKEPYMDEYPRPKSF